MPRSYRPVRPSTCRLPSVFASLSSALAVLGAATLLVTPAVDALAANDGSTAKPSPVYTGNVIVRWRDTVDASNAAEQVRKVASNTGLTLAVKRQMGGNMQLLNAASGTGPSDPEALAARLRQDPRVAEAVPDRWLRPHDTVPADPEFLSNQPYLQGTTVAAGAANLPPAWDRSRGDASLVIAVIDTGVLPHPDLASRLVNGYDFISDSAVSQDGDGRDADPTDAGDHVPSGYTCPGSPTATQLEPNSWHGTRVASVLGALTNNGQDISGVDWNARIQPVRVSGRCGAWLSDTVDAMRWAGGLSVPGVPDNPTPARVINVSLGGGDACSPIEQGAINELAARGVVVVAAAGNNGGAVEAPARCSGVVAVTAHVNDGENAIYASVGPEVALSAPGGGCGTGKWIANSCAGPVSAIRTLSNDGQTMLGNYNVADSQGTSFAAPIVSGVAALMLATNGGLTSAQVGDLLKSTARPHPVGTYCTTHTGVCGAGLLDAGAALAAAAAAPAASGQPAPVGTPVATSSGSSGGGGGAVGLWAGALLAVGGLLARLAGGRRGRHR